MRPEELKSIQYNFTDRVFILYVNGTEVWRRTRSEFANSMTESVGIDVYTVRLKVENGEFVFAIYPKFNSQTVKITGPLRLGDDKHTFTLSEEKTDWFIGIKKIESEFGTKDKTILDNVIDEYKRKVAEHKSKIKEYESKIKEYENIIRLLEKIRSDKKWK